MDTKKLIRNLLLINLRYYASGTTTVTARRWLNMVLSLYIAGYVAEKRIG